MKKARLKNSFSIVQWHGDEYPYYEEDAQENLFKEDDILLVLYEVEDNINKGQALSVVYHERIQESATIASDWLEILEDEQ